MDSVSGTAMAGQAKEDDKLVPVKGTVEPKGHLSQNGYG